jgi:hypothetical protein
MNAVKDTTELFNIGIEDGPLRKTEYGKYILLYCPVCGVDLQNVKRTSDHIRKHTPEDFGLEPLQQ